MKFWVALVALTLLAGCGAELSAPTPSPSPSPTPPGPPARLWGFLGALGEAAENATERLRQSSLVVKLQTVAQELRELQRELRARVAEYGQEARALLELGLGDLRARGAAFARKFRKRLGRDHEELRRRWEGGGAAAFRALWETPRVGGETP